MRPLRLSHIGVVSSLGQGLAAHLEALRSGHSGLRTCRFEDTALQTHAGAIDALDLMRLEGELAVFDCRNNRAAELALRQDGFADAVAAARARHGAQPSTHRLPRPSGAADVGGTE